MSNETHISREDLAAFTLGALPDSEVSSVETHLESCKRCQDDVRWLLPAVEMLPETVEQITPPPQLRENLLDIVRADAELSGAATRRRPVKQRRLRLGRFALAPATALAAVLIAVAALAGYELNSGGGEDAPSTRTVAVASQANGSQASLVINATSATLQAVHVPQLPPGSVYQVWVRNPGGQATPSSVFRPSNDGSAAAAVPEVLEGAHEVMITREPGKGSRTPTLPVVYSATVNS
ncbi:MAG: anti-sigma factor domain-containing protein [Solirubrobacterales bacterium]